ncbi:DUF7261 family protein [Halobaculum magnesiiphilum]|uniref:Uncharacterized protein n=1 Tax=Halobaculum magnesiiphilum TaxID=1017351 RepID=A0A8T8WD67_9EURY|nr:hypothetical protein [Halobaculum magnesiiphilum]QZP37780.1 hypothetical protein K6T50_00945 [Halobaculum magnesiiphilum]
MADLMDGDGRGQLVLVAGFALAIVLVALVLLANTAIFTENLATRDNGVGERDVLGYRSSVVDGAGGIVDRENAAEYDDREPLEENVTAGLAALDSELRESAARRAASARADVDAATYTNGSLVRQNGTADDPRQFTNVSDDADWTVATDLERASDGNATRGFVAVVTANSLEPASESDPDDAFHVVVTNGSAAWHAYVYENSSSGTIAVAVKPAGEPASATSQVCSVSASNATVDFTGGRLGGVDCPGLAFGGDVAGGATTDGYDMLVRNGDRAAGGYDLTVRTAGSGSVSAGNLSATPSADEPYSVPAVYAVEVPIDYRTSEVTYAETVRVAPGERDE